MSRIVAGTVQVDKNARYGYDAWHYIALNLESGHLGQDYTEYGEPAMCIREYTGRIRRYGINPLSERDLEELLTEIQPLAQRVLDGAAIGWDGQNTAGLLDDDAEAAEREIEALCEAASAGSELGICPAEDWMVTEAFDDITADTTDEELDKIADEVWAEAMEHCDAVVIGVWDWLWAFRETLIAERDGTDD